MEPYLGDVVGEPLVYRQVPIVKPRKQWLETLVWGTVKWFGLLTTVSMGLVCLLVVFATLAKAQSITVPDACVPLAKMVGLPLVLDNEQRDNAIVKLRSAERLAKEAGLVLTEEMHTTLRECRRAIRKRHSLT